MTFHSATKSQDNYFLEHFVLKYLLIMNSSPIREANHLLAKQRRKYRIIIFILTLGLIGVIGSTTYLAVKLNGAYPSARAKFYVWNHPNAIKATENKLKLKVPNNSTVFTLMEHGAKRDSQFRFEFANFGFGRYITSIEGVEENIPGNMFWVLYKLDSEPNANKAPGIKSMAQLGIDGIRVKEGDIYLYWLQDLGTIEYPKNGALAQRKLAKETPCSTGYVGL